MQWPDCVRRQNSDPQRSSNQSRQTSHVCSDLPRSGGTWTTVSSPNFCPLPNQNQSKKTQCASRANHRRCSPSSKPTSSQANNLPPEHAWSFPPFHHRTCPLLCLPLSLPSSGDDVDSSAITSSEKITICSLWIVFIYFHTARGGGAVLEFWAHSLQGGFPICFPEIPLPPLEGASRELTGSVTEMVTGPCITFRRINLRKRRLNFLPKSQRCLSQNVRA